MDQTNGNQRRVFSMRSTAVMPPSPAPGGRTLTRVCTKFHDVDYLEGKWLSGAFIGSLNRWVDRGTVGLPDTAHRGVAAA